MERTIAKRAFARIANSIIRIHEDMSEDDLRESFSKLTKAAERVIESNDDLEARLIVDQEAGLDAGKVAVLTEQQKADLTKTASECQLRQKEAKDLIQQTLWTNFGASELSTALQAAEKACQRIADV